MLNGTRISGIKSSKTLIRSLAGSDLYITDAVFEDLIIKNVLNEDLKGGESAFMFKRFQCFVHIQINKPTDSESL